MGVSTHRQGGRWARPRRVTWWGAQHSSHEEAAVLALLSGGFMGTRLPPAALVSRATAGRVQEVAQEGRRSCELAGGLQAPDFVCLAVRLPHPGTDPFPSLGLQVPTGGPGGGRGLAPSLVWPC